MSSFFWPLYYWYTSSIYGFWLPLWYLQSFLKHSENNVTDKISECIWTICGRVASWVLIWLLPLWWFHRFRFDYRGYDGIMGNGLITTAMMLSWETGLITCAMMFSWQRVDSLNYYGVMVSELVTCARRASWVVVWLYYCTTPFLSNI